jgi:hypothetical protein
MNRGILKGHFRIGVGPLVGESVGAGSTVEFGDEFAGGASMIESNPWLRSCCQAAKTCSVMVDRSPTCTLRLSR